MAFNFIAANSNMHAGLDKSPDGAAGDQPSDLEKLKFVPVDVGVYLYIKKMYSREIQKIERQFKVKIICNDVDVNTSSMVKIIPDGKGCKSNIRGAKDAVVDLYSTVFSQMNHRVVQLEESSISRESLQRAVSDAESLYSEVMVILSGQKVRIYGMKELDVKVVKSMITTRLYNTGRSASRSDHDENNDDWSYDMGRLASRSSQFEQSPYIAGADVGKHGNQGANKNKRAGRISLDYVTQRDANQTADREYLRGFEADDEGPRLDAQASSLKCRFRNNRLSFRTAEGLKVRVYQADITQETVGAIVNAANESLIHAGGVAGAIERAAGSLMTSECQLYIAKHGMLYPTKVMSTTSGNLPCKYIIHAVGPRWGEYKNNDECFETLKTTFVKCLEYAEKMHVTGISMPLISSGIFGMPRTTCVDALYEALIHYSKSWHKDVSVLKEVNLVEIDGEIVKTMQDNIIQKIKDTTTKMAETAPTNYDFKDLTQCGICLMELQQPKALPCLHSYCLTCLSQWAKGKDKVACPLCAQKFEIPSGGVNSFQTNFIINSLKDRAESIQTIQSKETVAPCANCEVLGSKIEGHCNGCKGFICGDCVAIHTKIKQLKDHTIIPYADLQSGKVNIKDIYQRKHCKIHEEQVLRFYCETCEGLICRDCTVVDHPASSHSLVNLESASKGQKTEIEQLASSCNGVRKRVDECLKELDVLSEMVDKSAIKAEEDIDKAFHNVVKILEDNRKKLKDEVKAASSERKKQISVEKDGIQLEQAKLVTALQMATEVIQTGSEYDLAQVFTSLKTNLTALRDMKPKRTFKTFDDVIFKPTQTSQEVAYKLGSISS